MIFIRFEGQLGFGVDALSNGGRKLRIVDQGHGNAFEVEIPLDVAEKLSDLLRSPTVPIATSIPPMLRRNGVG